MILPFVTAAEIAGAVEPVRAHLARDRILGYPTETVYGIGAAPSKAGTERLALLKGRRAGKPFLLLVASREMAEAWGLMLNPAATAMAQAFWPGALTLVLPGAEGKLPDLLRGPEGGIAVRYTSHQGMRSLIQALGFPVSSTSANRPGSPPAPGAAGITEAFPEAVEQGNLLILDGGVLGNVPPSTVVDCMTGEAKLVREGAIPRAELRRAVGRFAP